MMKTIDVISKKSINYPFAAMLWIGISLLLFWLCLLVGMHSKFSVIMSFISGGIIAFGDRKYVQILSSGLLLFNKEEVKDENGNSIWVDPGMYFTFYIYSFSEKEHQVMEKRDIIVPTFACQDKNHYVMNAEANGDWKITDHDKFKEQIESNMESNLLSLVRRSIIRVFATLDFDDEIKGKDMGDIITRDSVFIRECEKYGIGFHNLIVDAIPFNLEQENINAYADRLFAKEKAKYPPNHQLTPEQIDKINEAVQVQLKLSKKITTNSALFGRYDVT